MYGPLFSVLMMGMIPVWGIGRGAEVMPLALPSVSPPSILLSRSGSFVDLNSRLSASGMLIVDVESGQVIAQKDAQVPRPMASLTKLMTALIIVENHELDEWVKIPKEAASASGNRAYLEPGTHFTVGDLLSALLISSANDAAVSLALFHSGSVSAFVDAMNERAQVLGLKHTTYANPAGLDDVAQISSPQDIAWLGRYLFRSPEIAERLSQKSGRIRSREGYAIGLSHTHALLHAQASESASSAGSPIVRAGKTGTTEDAGQCLLSVVEWEGRTYEVVLLKSADRYADMRRALAAFDD